MNITLVIYCVLIALASLLGGWIPSGFKLGHRQTQLILSLVSGVMLGVAMLHLLPNSIRFLNNESTAMAIALGGLLFMFFMIRMFSFHYHDSDEAEDPHHCDHHDHQHEIRRTDVSWVGLAIGFSVHTIIDGIALAAATGGNSIALAGVTGLGVFLAILLHKPLDAMAITSLMAARGWPAKKRSLVNGLFALMCPLGALIFVSGISVIGPEQEQLFGVVLAFSAGVFLCISLSDLLPEVQFHSHDRLAMSGALLLGVSIAATLELLPF